MTRARINQALLVTAGAALAGTLLASLTLTGCTLVDERITGVTLDRANPTTCVRQCNDRYGLLFDLERKRHAMEVERCQAIPDKPAMRICLQDEALRFEGAMGQMVSGKTDCLASCTRTGAGR